MGVFFRSDIVLGLSIHLMNLKIVKEDFLEANIAHLYIVDITPNHVGRRVDKYTRITEFSHCSSVRTS